MTEDEAVSIIDNEIRKKECVEYLIANVIADRKFAREICGDENDAEAEPYMLASLLASEVVFLNTHWGKPTWPEEAQKTIALYVNCNDVFAWGYSDAEELSYDEIGGLFDHWQKDPEWGSAIWCIKKRKQMPQKPVENIIKNKGIWDLYEVKKSFK